MPSQDDAGDARRTCIDVVSPFCGGACDDHRVTVENNLMVAVEGACEAGREGFQSFSSDIPTVLIDSRAATLEEAIDRTAAILVGARAPLIAGLQHLTCEAQSLAVSLADLLGATVDSVSPDTLRSNTNLCNGQSSCTLGEVRRRADLVVLWRPFFSDVPCAVGKRWLFDSTWRHGDRPKVIIVGPPAPDADESYEIIKRADQHIDLDDMNDFEAVWVLRALVKGERLDSEVVRNETGIALQVWQRFADRMTSCRYGVILAGSLQPYIERALNELAIELNSHVRFAYLGGSHNLMNEVGADQVLTWRTGYPYAVNFARSYPRFGPDEFTADRLAQRRETDAVLLFGFPTSPVLTREGYDRLPVIALSNSLRHSDEPVVFVRTAQPGVETAGTIFRFDGVPLPLRKLVDCELPSHEEVLRQLLDRVKHLQDQPA